MKRKRPGRGRRAGRLAIAGGVVAVLSGCIGTIPRQEFNEVIQERGGGFTSELPLEAVSLVTDDLGVEDVELRSMTVTPESETVILEVRDPRVPENLDRYVVSRGEITTVEPVRLTAADDLDRDAFAASGLALDRIESMVDSALAGFNREGGHVGSMVVNRPGGDGVVFQLALVSPRVSGSATFNAGGELLGVSER